MRSMIESLKRDIDMQQDLMREAQMEVEEAESRMASLAREYERMKEELEDLEAEEEAQEKMTGGVDVEGPARYGCMDCGEFWPGNDSASEFRADTHRDETGHRIALVLPGGSPLFEQDCLLLEAQP